MMVVSTVSSSCSQQLPALPSPARGSPAGASPTKISSDHPELDGLRRMIQGWQRQAIKTEEQYRQLEFDGESRRQKEQQEVNQIRQRLIEARIKKLEQQQSASKGGKTAGAGNSPAPSVESHRKRRADDEYSGTPSDGSFGCDSPSSLSSETALPVPKRGFILPNHDKPAAPERNASILIETFQLPVPSIRPMAESIQPASLSIRSPPVSFQPPSVSIQLSPSKQFNRTAIGNGPARMNALGIAVGNSKIMSSQYAAGFSTDSLPVPPYSSIPSYPQDHQWQNHGYQYSQQRVPNALDVSRQYPMMYQRGYMQNQRWYYEQQQQQQRQQQAALAAVRSQIADVALPRHIEEQMIRSLPVSLDAALRPDYMEAIDDLETA